MKRLGLLGGMSWESSIEYERTINELVRERVGGLASADLIIRSFNFADIEALQVDGKWDEAGQVLADAAVHWPMQAQTPSLSAQIRCIDLPMSFSPP